MKRETDSLKFWGWCIVFITGIEFLLIQNDLTPSLLQSIFFMVFFAVLPALLLSTVSTPEKEVK